MINAMFRTYNYFTFGSEDSYGQPVLSNEPVGTIKMSIHLTNQAVIDNIKYRDASYIALTLDNSINDSYVIEYGNEKLKVLYTNTVGRYTQVFLQEI